MRSFHFFSYFDGRCKTDGKSMCDLISDPGIINSPLIIICFKIDRPIHISIEVVDQET